MSNNQKELFQWVFSTYENKRKYAAAKSLLITLPQMHG